MTCRHVPQSARCAEMLSLDSMRMPRMVGRASEPDAPVKPEERPATAPQREDPRYPSHTPPSPETKPSRPCPIEDPEEGYPACRGELSASDRHRDSIPKS